MADPKTKIETIQDNDEITISPNGDTTAERYAKVKEREAKMSMEERVKKLREGAARFKEMLPDFYDEDAEDAED